MQSACSLIHCAEQKYMEHNRTRVTPTSVNRQSEPENVSILATRLRENRGKKSLIYAQTDIVVMKTHRSLKVY